MKNLNNAYVIWYTFQQQQQSYSICNTIAHANITLKSNQQIESQISLNPVTRTQHWREIERESVPARYILHAHEWRQLELRRAPCELVLNVAAKAICTPSATCDTHFVRRNTRASRISNKLRVHALFLVVVGGTHSAAISVNGQMKHVYL